MGVLEPPPPGHKVRIEGLSFLKVDIKSCLPLGLLSNITQDILVLTVKNNDKLG